MVNFFAVTSGKLIECQKQEIGKLIGCQCGKQIQCQVVNFFIDIHTGVGVPCVCKSSNLTESVLQLYVLVIFYNYLHVQGLTRSYWPNALLAS